MIALPVRVRSCLICTHAQVGQGDTLCLLVGESVMDEKATAEHCETYDPLGRRDGRH